MNYFLLPYELLVTSFRKFNVESRKYNYYFINMEKNLFVCYSREDYEFVASFELEFIRAKNNSTIASSNNLQIELQIDKNPGVISLGDKYQEKIEKIKIRKILKIVLRNFFLIFKNCIMYYFQELICHAFQRGLQEIQILFLRAPLLS